MHKLFRLIEGKEHYYAEWVGLAKKPWGGIALSCNEHYCFKEVANLLDVMLRMTPVVEHISMDTRVHPGDWEW